MSEHSERIEAHSELAREAGGCNGCTDRTGEYVTVLELRTTSFRLCDKCLGVAAVILSKAAADIAVEDSK